MAEKRGTGWNFGTPCCWNSSQAAPRLTYLVDFSAKAECIGRQQHTWALLEDGNYALELAKARTFTTLEDAEAAREAGLIKGGSPVNALIAEGSEYYNPPLRYENEPVRHKLLDLVRVCPPLPLSRPERPATQIAQPLERQIRCRVESPSELRDA
jgi:hypothetical protein